MTAPVLRLTVFGTPGTAGSKSAFPVYTGSGPDKRWTGRVSVAEKDRAHTKRNWRQAIIDAAHTQIACPCTEPGCTSLAAPFPLDEAVAVSMVFTVKKPAAAPKSIRTWPVARPDALKYARAAEDALTAAGVLRDDARVVEYTRLAKVFPREDPDALDVPGVLIQVWRVHDLIGWQRDATTAPAAEASLFDPIAQ